MIIMRNRSRSDIMADILSKLETPKLKTSVMFECSLSHKQLKSYYEFMNKKGLIAEEDRKWVSTPRGRAYLGAYKMATGLIQDYLKS